MGNIKTKSSKKILLLTMTDLVSSTILARSGLWNAPSALRSSYAGWGWGGYPYGSYYGGWGGYPYSGSYYGGWGNGYGGWGGYGYGGYGYPYYGGYSGWGGYGGYGGYGYGGW